MEINSAITSGLAPVAYAKTKGNTAGTAGELTETRQTTSDSIWHQMASQYDVRHITGMETAELSQYLYDAGEISLLDHATLSFNPNHGPSGSGFLTPETSIGHRDLISEYEARIQMDNKAGNDKNLVSNERIFEYLGRLDAAKNSPIHVAV